MTELDHSPSTWPGDRPQLSLVLAALGDVGWVALIVGWVVTRSWGWVALSAIVLAIQLARQRVVFPAWRAGRQPTPPRRPWLFIVVLVGELVLPIVAVLRWDPPWHGLAGALMLAKVVFFHVWVLVAVRRYGPLPDGHGAEPPTAPPVVGSGPS